MKFTGKRNLYRFNKRRGALDLVGTEDVQELVNSSRDDTFDAILRKLLEDDIDPVSVYGQIADVDTDEIVDDFGTDVFEIATQYSENLKKLGLNVADPAEVVTAIQDKFGAFLQDTVGLQIAKAKEAVKVDEEEISEKISENIEKAIDK